MDLTSTARGDSGAGPTTYRITLPAAPPLGPHSLELALSSGSAIQPQLSSSFDIHSVSRPSPNSDKRLINTFSFYSMGDPSPIATFPALSFNQAAQQARFGAIVPISSHLYSYDADDCSRPPSSAAGSAASGAKRKREDS